MIELYRNSLKFTFPEVHPQAELKSIMQKAHEQKDNPLPENEPVKPEKIKVLKDVRKVREGRF